MIWKITLLFTMIFCILLFRQYNDCIEQLIALSNRSTSLISNISDSLTKERNDGMKMTRPLMNNFSVLQENVRNKDGNFEPRRKTIK